jgi:broad specificity phosphatase PhoE
MKFVIVRHGERIDKVDPNWLATAEHPTDPFLSDVGFEQARFVGQHLKRTENVTRIIVSPFTRTLQTATEINKSLDLPLCVEPGICEWLNPEWHRGAPFYWPPLEDAKLMFPGIQSDYKPLLSPPDHEDRKSVRMRVGKFANLLAASLEPATGEKGPDTEETVLLVTHGKIVEELAVSWTRVEDFPWVTYCCVTQVVQVPTSGPPPSFRLGDSVCDVSFLPEAIRPHDSPKREIATYA